MEYPQIWEKYKKMHLAVQITDKLIMSYPWISQTIHKVPHVATIALLQQNFLTSNLLLHFPTITLRL